MERFNRVKRQLDYDKRSGCARVIPISCLHIGHRNYMEGKARKFLDYILRTKGTYAIMLGDTVENVITSTAGRIPGTIHDQVMSVEEQREQAVKLLKPLAGAGKILAWTESNHSLRSWRDAGFSPEKWICHELKQDWCGHDALLDLRVGRQRYFIHALHGTGAGTAISSVAGKLEKQAHRVTGADAYLRGHHHKKLISERMDIRADTGKLKKQVLAATGCFMSYIGGYGHEKELPPVVPGCVKLKLYADRWDIHATL